jgi:hypothetical protein
MCEKTKCVNDRSCRKCGNPLFSHNISICDTCEGNSILSVIIRAADERRKIACRRSKKICDYSGYSCDCEGYRKAKEGSTRCECGHAKSQHHEREEKSNGNKSRLRKR